MSSMIGDGVASPRLGLAVVGGALCPDAPPAVGAGEPLQPVTATNAQAATTPRLRRSRIPSTGSRIRDSTPGHLPGMAPLLVLRVTGGQAVIPQQRHLSAGVSQRLLLPAPLLVYGIGWRRLGLRLNPLVPGKQG